MELQTEEQIAEWIRQVSENVLDGMKCRECDKYCHPPLRFNTLNEILCAECYQKRVCCKIDDPVHRYPRDFFLEKMYFEFHLHCKYREYGCEFFGSGNSLNDHHKKCEYFVMKCPRPHCTKKDKPQIIMDHIRNDHPDYSVTSSLNITVDSNDKEQKTPVMSKNYGSFDGRIFMSALMLNLSEKYFKCIATNMDIFDVDDYELEINFELEGGLVISKVVNFFYSSNDQKENGLSYPEESHDLPDNFQIIHTVIRRKSVQVMEDVENALQAGGSEEVGFGNGKNKERSARDIQRL